MAGLNLLDAIRSRPVSKGIGTADYYLRQFEQCLGGSCPSKYFDGISEFRWRKGLDAAGRKLVYHDPSMDVDGDFAWYVGEKAAAPQVELPPHTIATFPCVITTTTQDRDGDVLETIGATLDPKAPLLYQHMPFENIGRLLLPGKQTKNKLTGTFSICGTALGEDAAMLAEHGALRISHGFTASEWEQLNDESGVHVLKFQILEVSLVSIPSNPDAELTAFSREKLKSPIAKALAGIKYANRPVISSVPIDVASLAHSLPEGTSVTFSKSAAPKHPEPAEQPTACSCKSKEPQTESPVSASLEVKSVVPYKKTPASDSDSWDADEAVKGLRKWAGVDGDEPTDAEFGKYKQGFGIVDGDADNLTSYKYPHHEVDGDKLTVNYSACAAVVAALNGGRGGTTLSESDRKGLYNHIKKHYKDSFPDKDVPELKLVNPLGYKGNERDFFNPEKSAPTKMMGTKGVYVEFENSFDDIRQDLNDSLLSYLIANQCGDADDCCYISDLFLYQALVCVIERSYMYGPYGSEGCRYFMIDWEMGPDQEPVWTGAPQEVEITPQITAVDKGARAMFVKSLKSGSDETESTAKTGDEKAVADPTDVQQKAGRKLSKTNVAKVKSAASNFKAIADDDEADAAVTDLATKAYDALKGVFGTGGDDGSDQDAYTDAGEKAGRAVSKETEGTIRDAMGHGMSISGHDKASGGHKSLSRSAVKKLKSVVGDETPDDDFDPNDTDPNNTDGYDGSTGGKHSEPVEISVDSFDVKEVAASLYRRLAEATVDYAIHGDDGSVKALHAFAAEFAKQTEDTTSRIEGQRRFDAEEALVSQAVAEL